MSDRTFQAAYSRVRARHTAEGWLALSPRQIADEIYREIRAIDAERAEARESERIDAPPRADEGQHG